MDPYRSVWVRMVPGDLFQGFRGPNPFEKTRQMGFGVLEVGGGPPPGPCGLPSSLRGFLTYMELWRAYGLSEDPGLTTYFFPGRDGVGRWG